MAKKVILIGNGSYSDTLRYYIDSVTDWQICGYASEFVVDEGLTHEGLPLVNVNKLKECFPANEYEIVICVGYSNMNTNRKRIYSALKAMNYRIPNLIHPTSILNNLSLGDGNIILENCVFEPRAVMGSNIIIWSSSLIGHDTYIGDHSHFAAASLIAGNCRVGEGCFLGNHSTVKDGVELAEYTLVGAGAYVSKDTNPFDVVVPARSIVLEKYKSTDLI